MSTWIVHTEMIGVRDTAKLYTEAKAKAADFKLLTEKQSMFLDHELEVIGIGQNSIVMKRVEGKRAFALKLVLAANALFEATEEVTMLLFLRNLAGRSCPKNLICYSRHFKALVPPILQRHLEAEIARRGLLRGQPFPFQDKTDWTKPLFFVEVNLYDGNTFDELIDQKDYVPALTRQQRLSILRSAVGALEFMHTNNAYHRDLKPANIMLINKMTASPQSVLIDVAYGCEKTLCKDVVGSPSYWPPSFYDYIRTHGYQQPPADAYARMDVYALGATFYDLLSNGLTAQPHDRHRKPTISANWKPAPFVDADIKSIIERMMAYDAGAEVQITAKQASDLLKKLKNKL